MTARTKRNHQHNCAKCGVSFVGTKFQKFCTKKCKWKHHRRSVGLVVKTCKTCRAEFIGSQRQSFCSAKCRDKFHGLHRVKKPWPVCLVSETCKWCGTEFTKSQRKKRFFCGQKCSRAFHNAKNKGRSEQQKASRRSDVGKKRTAEQNARVVIELRNAYVAKLVGMPVGKIPLDILELKRKQIELIRILNKDKENANV
jgi:hypothetical protein